MRQFKVCKTVVVIGITCMLFACGGAEQHKNTHVYKWRLQSQALNTTIDFIELQKWSDQLRIMSQGRLDITVYAGGEIVHGPNIFTAVKDGDIQMGNGWPNWWSSQHPAWGVMNAGPFDFMNIDASMIFFLAGEGVALANELSKPIGVMWRPAWWAGMEFGLMSKEPINTLDDLKGKKVRIGPGLPSEVLAAASGSYAIPLVPEEIRTALQNDEIDAVEWTTTNGAWELGLSDISSYAIVPAIWQPSVLSDFLINQKAYDALPEDLKTMLDVSMQAYTLTTTMKSKAADIQALKNFQDSGTIITKWSEEDVDKWYAANEKIVETYKKNHAFTKKLIESKQSFKKRYDDYYDYFGPYDQKYH